MGINKKIIKWIDSNFYRDVTSRWDDKILREYILKYLSTKSKVLDVGAGRGRVTEMDFRGFAKLIEGIDPDESVVENPLIDKAYVGLADCMPFFENERFDIVYCDNVLEHVEDPYSFYKEISRVLKKGGFFISKTPNKYNHVSVIASITPLSFHQYINRLRHRKSADTFPTFYRANTKRSQKKWADMVGLKINELEYITKRDEYLRINFISYLIALLYERFINFFNIKALKMIIITVMQK